MEIRHPTVARRDDSVLVVIDCQTKLWKNIFNKGDLEGSLPTLLEGAGHLGIPVLLTEQYPKGLGRTTAKVKRAVKDAPLIEKLSFSCFGEGEFNGALRELDRSTLILTGVETHVCILQTALDAIASGYSVQVAEDGVGSREQLNHEVGLRRVQEAGGVVTCVESLLFEWMERCDIDEFKSVVNLLK
jgi:nicotinamidase-related amidase